MTRNTLFAPLLLAAAAPAMIFAVHPCLPFGAVRDEMTVRDRLRT